MLFLIFCCQGIAITSIPPSGISVHELTHLVYVLLVSIEVDLRLVKLGCPSAARPLLSIAHDSSLIRTVFHELIHVMVVGGSWWWWL